jgi:hypothetical protein
MIDIEDKTEYTFRYIDCDGKTYTSQFENPGPTWMEALDDFVGFLESVYKYDIRSKIRIKEPAYQRMVENEAGYLDLWHGEYFTDDEDSKENTHFSWDE